MTILFWERDAERVRCRDMFTSSLEYRLSAIVIFLFLQDTTIHAKYPSILFTNCLQSPSFLICEFLFCVTEQAKQSSVSHQTGLVPLTHSNSRHITGQFEHLSPDQVLVLVRFRRTEPWFSEEGHDSEDDDDFRC